MAWDQNMSAFEKRIYKQPNILAVRQISCLKITLPYLFKQQNPNNRLHLTAVDKKNYLEFVLLTFPLLVNSISVLLKLFTKGISPSAIIVCTFFLNDNFQTQNTSFFKNTCQKIQDLCNRETCKICIYFYKLFFLFTRDCDARRARWTFSVALAN